MKVYVLLYQSNDDEPADSWVEAVSTSVDAAVAVAVLIEPDANFRSNEQFGSEPRSWTAEGIDEDGRGYYFGITEHELDSPFPSTGAETIV